jgi:hypothetical protein
LKDQGDEHIAREQSVDAGSDIRSIGPPMFVFGLLIILAAVVTGTMISPELGNLGMDAYLSRQVASAWPGFMLFAFGVPLGLGISTTGLIAASGCRRNRLLWISLCLLVIAVLPVLVPHLTGREPEPVFFGVSGCVLVVLIVVSLLFWSKYRAGLRESERLATDLQGIGYVCFAMAAWNLCGIGGMPSFALDPETMLSTGSRGFATGHMKTIMLQLLAGWTFTVSGFYSATRPPGKPPGQDHT